MKRQETGTVLILVIVLVSVITYLTIILLNETLDNSYLATRRLATVQALALAENAVNEAYHILVFNPVYRGQKKQYLNDAWYQYQIIDPTPTTTDDLNLAILGEGESGNFRRQLKLTLRRENLETPFRVVAWSEYK